MRTSNALFSGPNPTGAIRLAAPAIPSPPVTWIGKGLIEFYRRRSSAALHCAIVGNVVIPGGHGSNGNAPTISRAPEWAELEVELRWNREADALGGTASWRPEAHP